MSDQIRNEIAREKIRQMIREGKHPDWNYDRDIHEFRLNNSTDDVQDEIAKEKIRMMIARGETVGKTFSEHSDNDIRGYLQRSQSNSGSQSYSSSSSNSNAEYQQKENQLNSGRAVNLLTITEIYKKHYHILEYLYDGKNIILGMIKDGGPDWYIAELYSLKNQFESRMKSLDYDYENTIERKKTEANNKAELARQAEAERVKIYNNSPEGRAVAARQKAQTERIAQQEIFQGIVCFIGIAIAVVIFFYYWGFAPSPANFGGIVAVQHQLGNFVAMLFWQVINFIICSMLANVSSIK
jgi:hypothetical protein